MDIAAWLGGLGLGQYARAFAENGVDAEVLSLLTAEDLREIGVSAVGHRRKLIDAITALQDRGMSAPRAGGDEAPPAGEPAGHRVIARSREGERRQLTVLFADLAGSTPLSARLDPEEMREVLRAYQDAVAGAAARFGGYVAKLMGDGVLAYFGWPQAQEDEAERAVRTGLAIVDTIPRLATPAGGPLAARVGIASGLVVVGDVIGEGTAREEVVVGETPNLAARLQDAAAPGTVAIDDGTARLLGQVFELQDLGATPLKGFEHPVACYRVIGERLAESRFEAHQPGRPAPMVGRDQELALVLERWRCATAGEGQAVLLVGEAGIGKSRLIQATLDAIDDGQAHTALRYQCSPYHTGTALWPIIQQLGHVAGLLPGDNDDAKLDKIETLLRQNMERIDEAAPLVGALLGIDTSARYPALQNLSPQQWRARTLTALIAQLLGLAGRRGPVLMVLEDAHWADPTSLELVGQALDQIARARVLMLLTSRPDNQPALGGHPLVTRLTLNRLGRGPTEAIVARLATGRDLPPEVLEEIAARTDGVPLFVEELTKAVLEAGGAGPRAAVPASLHASLMARLDRVPGVKEVAQVAACIGREFAYPLLKAVCPVPAPELHTALGLLSAAELVFRRGEPPEASYSFKHALIRDVAYESLLKARRREVHGRIADALMAAGEAPPELLAHHAARAGRVQAAAALWLEAGRQAYARSSIHEGVAHARAALGRLAELPASADREALELQTRLALGQGLLAARGWADAEAGEQFAAAGEIARRVGSTEQRTASLFGVFQQRLNRWEFDLARPLAEEILRVAEGAGDDGAQIVGHRSLGTLAFFGGQPLVAERHLRCAIELHDRARHDDLASRYGFNFRSGAMAPLAISLVSQGRVAEGLALAEEALVFADKLPSRYDWCHTACLAAYAHDFARADARLSELAEGTARVCIEQGFALFRARAEMLVGLVRARAGDTATALRLVRHGMAGVAATGTRLTQSYDQAILAETLLLADDSILACEAAREGIAIAYRTGEHFVTPVLLTLKAMATLAMAKPEQARPDLERAVVEARSRGMRLFELRATCHLARLWTEGGERGKALDLLVPVYDGFPGGSGVADLVEAEQLLNALRS